MLGWGSYKGSTRPKVWGLGVHLPPWPSLLFSCDWVWMCKNARATIGWRSEGRQPRVQGPAFHLD